VKRSSRKSRRETGTNWVHVALAAVSRFVIALQVGPRTKAMAVELVASVAVCATSAGGSPPLFLVDDDLPYRSAILEVYGQVKHRRRRRGRGRRKHPGLKPPDGLLAGVVKKVRDATGHLLRVTTRGLFGAKKTVVARVQELGLGDTINTAHVERLNGTLRCQQARLTRRTRTISRRRRFLQWSLWLWRDLYNWSRPHRTLGQTPAMAEGLTDHAWSVSDYVRYPVHVSDLMRDIWADDRQNVITSALNRKKPRETVPTS
jgi:IS1 family transposase